MHGSNKEHRHLEKHSNSYAAVIEKHTLDGSNTITFMKHKHRYVTLGMSIRMEDATAVAIMFSIVVAISYKQTDL